MLASILTSCHGHVLYDYLDHFDDHAFETLGVGHEALAILELDESCPSGS